MNRIVQGLALTLLAMPLHADLELTLRTHHESKPPKGVQRISPKNADESLHVILGRDWHSVDDGASKSVFDFAKRRVYTIGADGYTDASLFANAAGREVELDNRIFLGKMMAKSGGTAADSFALPLQEHELSLQKAGSPAPKFTAAVKRGEQVRSWEKKELLAWSEERVEATAAERAAFVRFLRYRFGGHPVLLAELQQGEGIPKRVRITIGMINDITTIEVKEARHTENAPVPAMTGTRAPSDDAELEPSLVAARAMTPFSAPSVRTKRIDEAKRAAAEQRALALVLGGIELNLMFGGTDFLAELQPYIEPFHDDPNVQAFVLSMSPQSAEEAKRAVATMERLQKVAPEKAYVLGIFHGNFTENLGDRETAAADYRAALKANPLLTGVWKDYGTMLLNGYHAHAAWECWDAARAISPTHGLLAEIDELEARLLKEHPEYF